MTKKCKKCLKEKNFSEFYVDRRSSDGLLYCCKKCISIIRKDYNKRIDVKEKKKKYYITNNKRIRKYVKEYRKNPMVNKRRNILRQKRKQIDLNFKLRETLRASIYFNIKRNKGKKTKNTEKLLGCTIKELKRHLESQFKEGMTWDNYGEWHIDHIVPCSSFNLIHQYEQKICFNWFNLQPLWAIENMIKNDKYIKI